MPSSFLSLLCLLCLLVADWPQFRGPTGQGVSEERGLPLTWSENKNVRWKVAISGRGWSSPVVQGDRIWLTTATEEGRSLRAIAIDRNTGAIVQNLEVFSPEVSNVNDQGVNMRRKRIPEKFSRMARPSIIDSKAIQSGASGSPMPNFPSPRSTSG